MLCHTSESLSISVILSPRWLSSICTSSVPFFIWNAFLGACAYYYLLPIMLYNYIFKFFHFLTTCQQVWYCRFLLTKLNDLQSSFLGRASNSSLSSSRKRVSSTMRSYIFERDDSNSRSAISMSEDSSDTVSLIFIRKHKHHTI